MAKPSTHHSARSLSSDHAVWAHSSESLTPGSQPAQPQPLKGPGGMMRNRRLHTLGDAGAVTSTRERNGHSEEKSQIRRGRAAGFP